MDLICLFFNIVCTNLYALHLYYIYVANVGYQALSSFYGFYAAPP